MLYSEVVEVDCRVIPVLPDKCKLGPDQFRWNKVDGITGEQFYVTKEMDDEEVSASLKKIKDKGIKSIAVALAHSYAYHEQEVRVGEIARKLGRYTGCRIQDDQQLKSLCCPGKDGEEGQFN